MEEKPILYQNSKSLTGLFVIACFCVLYFVKSIFLPLAVAILFSLLLAPVVRTLKRYWIPTSASAGIIVIFLFFSIGYGFYSLSGPANQWLSQSPQNFSLVTKKLQNLINPLMPSIIGFSKVKDQIAKSAQLSSDNKQQMVAVNNGSGLMNMFLSSTKEFLFELFTIIFVLYFLLASGDFFLRKVVEAIPSFQGKRDAVSVTHQIEHEIFTFLFAKVVTGIGLAISISIIMFLCKMPNPILWGVLAGVLEFIPYLGVILGTALVGITALITFDNPLHIFLVPISFFAVTSINGNFVFPLIIGRNLELHPVIIFIGVIFWGWLWGVTGALIAIPMLSVLKIVCNNVPSLSRISKFLGINEEKL